MRAPTNQIIPYSHEPILQHAGDLTARSQKATGRLLGPATTMEVALHQTALSSRLLQERAQLRTEQKFKKLARIRETCVLPAHQGFCSLIFKEKMLM